MYDMLSLAKLPHHFIRLNEDFKSDLAWWSLFLSMERISHDVIIQAGTAIPTATVTSDASGSWGCGAFHDSQWFQLAWPDMTTAEQSINLKELSPIAVTLAIWGGSWRYQAVRCLTDNSAVVSILRTRTCKNKDVMQLLR